MPSSTCPTRSGRGTHCTHPAGPTSRGDVRSRFSRSGWVSRRWTGVGDCGTMRAMEAPQYVQHDGLKRWVADMVELCQPSDVHWCDGSDEEYERLCGELVEAGTFIRLNEQRRPEQLPRPFRPERRRPGGGPHVHLLEDQGRRRSDEQLDGPGRDEGHPARAVRRLHGRSDDVRDPVQHGSARFARSPSWGSRSPTRPTSR